MAGTQSIKVEVYDSLNDIKTNAVQFQLLIIDPCAEQYVRMLPLLESNVKFTLGQDAIQIQL